MTNTVKKYVTSALVLFGVAGLSYAAGAAKGKAPVNLAAADIVWEDYGGGAPLKVAKLWGDRTKGGEYGMLLKLPAGFEAGSHAHTHDYHAVNVQGTWVHTNDGDTTMPKDMAPGSYVMQPGKAFHNDICKGKVDCILFITQKGKGDFLLPKAPAGAKPAAAPAAPVEKK
jgi:hypothetical protein